MIKVQTWSKPASYLEILGDQKLDRELRICTDSRELTKGQAFLCLKGERFDAIHFIDQILERDPRLLIIKQEDKQKVLEKIDFSKTSLIVVTDTLCYLQELSQFHIKSWKEQDPENYLICVAGSNGKTTTKNMMTSIFENIFPSRIVSTRANNNNHIGVPLTLLEVNSKTKICICELGSNHPGEMKVLCEMTQPSIGVTTNIGATHLEFFDGLKDVFQEETQILKSIESSHESKKLFLLNTDDQFLNEIERKSFIKTFGQKNSDYLIDLDAKTMKSTQGEFDLGNAHLTGKHNFANLACSMAFALELFPKEKESIQNAALNFIPTQNRSQWIEIQGKKIFLDAYNANPDSMKASLQGFKEKSQGENALLIMGDMNELGDQAETFHVKTASFARELGFSQARFIGRWANCYQKGFGEISQVYSEANDYLEQFRVDLVNFDYLFLKASRSVRLESIIKSILD
ncbi:MAG: UDP-N-acetylmuramoyl-tripeptide--D-alanyl-D-alanine ligase [Halobacteriovoraceae bacterium]|nr:UDP-N-acetylmuramoyl-tripeptide--D-alanyl-D-alanine ligase [Halobacteriovoraceae bacterium]